MPVGTKNCFSFGTRRRLLSYACKECEYTSIDPSHSVESVTKITKTRYNIAGRYVSSHTYFMARNDLLLLVKSLQKPLASSTQGSIVYGVAYLINECCDNSKLWKLLAEFRHSFGACNEVQEQDSILRYSTRLQDFHCHSCRASCIMC